MRVQILNKEPYKAAVTPTGEKMDVEDFEAKRLSLIESHVEDMKVFVNGGDLRPLGYISPQVEYIKLTGMSLDDSPEYKKALENGF